MTEPGIAVSDHLPNEAPTSNALPARMSMHLEDRHHELGLSDDDLVEIYRVMLLTRRLDERIWSLNRMGKAPFAVSGQGHEAAQIGSAWALRHTDSLKRIDPNNIVDPTLLDESIDWTLPYYRDLGVVLTLGMTPEEVLLSVLSKSEDPNSGGRQMPNHWGSRRLGIISGSSPIATQIPHAAGLAMAAKLRGTTQVTMCYFGDGAASKGDFHEALNFAGIHRLPVIFICENNGYAISVPLNEESAVDDIAQHAHSYRMPGIIVDGNDVLDVYATTSEAINRARRGGGPTLIECKTYRFLGHTSDDDDSRYRPAEEVERWRKKDPLTLLQQYLIEQRLLNEASEGRIEAEIQTRIQRALETAEASEQAPPQTALTKVFARPLQPLFNAPNFETIAPSSQSPGWPILGDSSEGATERNVIETVRHTLSQLMSQDERVVIFGEDVAAAGGVFRATEGLQKSFGPRCFDTPLAESSIVGVAIGMALAGLRPIMEIQFADFIHSAFDQIVSEAARMYYRSNGDFNVPLVIRAPWGGGVHGALYHSQSIEAFYAHVPGLKVVAPSTPADVAGMLREAVLDPDPVLFLEHKKTYRLIKGLVPDNLDWRVPIGVADIARSGTDCSVITYGLHRHLALEAAELLAEEGYSIEVIDLRTISPFDRKTVVDSACRTGRVLVVHEDNISFGVGAEVAATIAEEAFYDLDVPVRRLATPDVPSFPYASSLEAHLLIGTSDIVTAIRSLLEE